MEAAASTSGQEQQERQCHRTVGSEPPKRPAGRTKFHETRHPVYRGVRRRGRVGQCVCEMRVHGTKGARLWLGTFANAEMAARAHDAAALVLSGPAACLNFADSAWRMLPVLATGSFGFGSAREIKAAVALAVVAFQLCPVPSSMAVETPTPRALFYMSSSDLLELDDEQWFGGMVAGPYYESLAQGMLVEPPDADRRRLGGAPRTGRTRRGGGGPAGGGALPSPWTARSWEPSLLAVQEEAAPSSPEEPHAANTSPAPGQDRSQVVLS